MRAELHENSGHLTWGMANSEGHSPRAFWEEKIKVVKGKGNQEVGLRKPDGIFKETSHMELGPRWEVRTSSWKLEDASAPPCPSPPGRDGSNHSQMPQNYTQAARTGTRSVHLLLSHHLNSVPNKSKAFNQITPPLCFPMYSVELI